MKSGTSTQEQREFPRERRYFWSTKKLGPNKTSIIELWKNHELTAEISKQHESPYNLRFWSRINKQNTKLFKYGLIIQTNRLEKPLQALPGGLSDSVMSEVVQFFRKRSKGEKSCLLIRQLAYWDQQRGSSWLVCLIWRVDFENFPRQRRENWEFLYSVGQIRASCVSSGTSGRFSEIHLKRKLFTTY